MSKHREISVAEFFEKNRHLLGFSNAQKAVVTCVKEAVDNSLDSCDEGRILPEIYVKIEDIGNGRLRLTVRDNGEGIDKEHIPNVFGKLLYGSKFHRLKQSRGQQGIGISAAVLYSQLTTGNPVRVKSKIHGKPTHYFEIVINIQKNEPEIIKDEISDNYYYDHGTEIVMDIEGKYIRGPRSVFNYLKHTAITNPHAKIILEEPDGIVTEFPRVTDELPILPKEIKPHPHGVELGILLRMIKNTSSRTVLSFLMNEFSRIGRNTAEEICRTAGINKDVRPSSLTKDDAEKLLRAMQEVKVQNPPTDCLSPIGQNSLEEGLRKELNPEFISVVTRNPSVYRGMPFQIEVAIAYGGDLKENSQILRFANKVPLLYNQGACVSTEAVKKIDWSRYGLRGSGEIPQGPIAILIHMCSVWVPFTSEGKEAIADYPEILREMILALQEAGRRLKLYIGKKVRKEIQEKKMKKLSSYALEMAPYLAYLTGKDDEEIKRKVLELIQSKYLYIQGQGDMNA